MRILEAVLKNDEIQNYSNEDSNVNAAFDHLRTNFKLETIYNLVCENINHFIVDQDLNLSYENIKNFSKNYTLNIINESFVTPSQLVDMVNSPTLTSAEKLTAYWDQLGSMMSAGTRVVKTFISDNSTTAFTKVASMAESARTTISPLITHPKAKLVIGCIGGVTILTGAGLAGLSKYLSDSDPSEAISASKQVVDNLDKGNDEAVVKTVEVAVGTWDQTKFAASSFFKSFVSACDGMFSKLQGSASEGWDKAKALADEHPNIAVGILALSSFGILYKFATRKAK